MTTDPKNRPDYVRPEVKALAPIRRRSRVLADGTDALWADPRPFLPQWPGEKPAQYTRRATLTELFEAYARTLQAAEGMVFAEPPKLADGAAPEFTALWDDADGEGNAAGVMLRPTFRQALTDGLAGVLVDFPPVERPDAVSMEDAARQNLRPYLVPVHAGQIVNWRVAQIGAKQVLTLLVLHEPTVVEDGLYGVTQDDRYRIFRRTPGGVTVEVLRKVKSDTGDVTFVPIVPMRPVVGPTEIPFAPLYAAPRVAPMVAAPPLNGLAVLNLGHWRVSSDHRYLMAVCHAPTLTIEGWSAPLGDAAPEIEIGPNVVLKLEGEAKAKWLQATPDSLAASERTMERQQAQMAALGMAFLARDGVRDSTATGRRLDAAADAATLGTAAFGLKDCLERALQFAAQFMGRAATEAPAVEVHTTYDPTRLDAPTILALSKLAEAQQITLATLLRELQRGGVLSAAVDLEAEELELAATAAATRDLLPAPGAGAAA